MFSSLANLDKKLNDRLLVELDLQHPFIEDPLPRERYGIFSVDGWQRNNEREVEIEGQVWLVAAFENYPEVCQGKIELLDKLDKVLGCLEASIEDRHILRMVWDGRISPSLRSPIKAPDKQMGHIWVCDLMARLSIRLINENLGFER